MYEFPSDLWAPQLSGITRTIDILQSGKSVCLQGPTGSGKTRQAIEIFKWAQSEGMGGVFFLNRRLLIPQTSSRFTSAGLPHGIRAAEYEDLEDYYEPFQIASVQTEWARVYESKAWKSHPANLVVVDEAHIQRGKMMNTILDDYRSRGAKIVLLTATPIGLSGMADHLVVSGTMQQYRECKAIVPAIVRSIEQPDLSKVKRSATGEFVLDGKVRKTYTQQIVGNVIDRWKRYNPDARPTLLYAPGKAESVWFTEQFEKQGVNWAHVDAVDAVVDGARTKLTRNVWNEIVDRYNSGDIKGISSRFKLREGVDLVKTYHCILATPIGSLASYIQTVGRVLRYSPETPDSVLVTDHGGNFLRLGSPNSQRDWNAWWNLKLSEGVISTMYTNSIKNGEIAEPIRCPKCEGERTGGSKCPHCGFEHQKSKRLVLMADGRMVEREGKLIRPKFIKCEPNTGELWAKMFWGFRKKKVAHTFSQMEAWFQHEYGYYPPRNLPLMPTSTMDWHSRVRDIPISSLRSKS